MWEELTFACKRNSGHPLAVSPLFSGNLLCLNILYLLVSPLSRVKCTKQDNYQFVCPTQPPRCGERVQGVAHRHRLWSVLNAGDSVTTVFVTARNRTRELPISPASPHASTAGNLKKKKTFQTFRFIFHLCFPWYDLLMSSETLVRGICNCFVLF